MPNYCSNTLVISKATNPQIERIIAAATRQELLQEFLPQPIWENTPNEDGVLPGPRYQRRYFDRATGQVRAWAMGPMFPNGKQDDRWYDWCISNWGTKWDAGEIDITREGSSLFLSFDTAWSPVSDQWLEALAAEIPGADIHNSFREDGCDFYGVSQVVENSAYTEIGAVSDVMIAWMNEHYSKEKIAIYNDEDHENYDEVLDEINEAWWDVESDQIAEALDKCQPTPN